MIHTIQNDSIKVSVQQTGAELCSIQWLADNTEFMWQASPEGWSNHAPILFPIIGQLKNESYHLHGQAYNMKKHGLLRNNPDFECVENTRDHLTFRFISNEDTRQSYPYNFEMQVSFRIEGNALIQSFHLKNHEKKAMYFSLGGHPAFNCPIEDHEEYSDYFLLFDRVETQEPYLLDQDGLVSDAQTAVFDKTNIIHLTKNLFEKDALILKNLKSRSVKLKSRNSRNQVLVSFPDFEYLGLWAKPGAPFVCIEPWMGVADNWNTNQQFEKKEGIRILPAREAFETEFRIEVSR